MIQKVNNVFICYPKHPLSAAALPLILQSSVETDKLKARVAAKIQEDGVKYPPWIYASVLALRPLVTTDSLPEYSLSWTFVPLQWYTKCHSTHLSYLCVTDKSLDFKFKIGNKNEKRLCTKHWTGL